MPTKYRNLFPYVGDKTARERLEELFDRKSTTGFLLGAMMGGLATTLVSAIAPGGLGLFSVATLVRVVLWLCGVGLTMLVAVYWERLAKKADEVAEKAEEKVDETTSNSDSN